MLKITHKIFSVVFLNIMGIIMIRGFYHNIVVLALMTFMIDVVSHWIA